MAHGCSCPLLTSMTLPIPAKRLPMLFVTGGLPTLPALRCWLVVQEVYLVFMLLVFIQQSM